MRKPDDWEKSGMTWWNSLSREERDRVLRDVEKVLGRPPSAADAWRVVGVKATAFPSSKAD
jgi:hypothetical protein